MRFVIVGAGRVGLRTARVLREEGHDVTLVEVDPDRVERAVADGFDVVEGDGSMEDVLERAGVETADALAGLSGDLNVNFVACMIANHHDCRTVLRIDEDYREEIYRRYADQVDEIVYPERLGALVAKNALLGGSIQAIAELTHDLQVLLVTISPDAPTRGYTFSEVELPARARILAFGKQGEPMSIPLPDDSLEPGDRLAVLAEYEVIDDVRQLLVGDRNGGEE